MELQILLYMFSNMSLASRVQCMLHQSWKCEMHRVSYFGFSDILIGCIFFTYIIAIGGLEYSAVFKIPLVQNSLPAIWN